VEKAKVGEVDALASLIPQLTGNPQRLLKSPCISILEPKGAVGLVATLAVGLGVVGAVSDLHPIGRGPCFCRVCMLEWRKGVGL
jgi:hypothetical protein